MSTESDLDYGPLSALIGTWTGDKGIDVSPEPDGAEESPYFETLVLEAAGDLENAESQTLTMLRYHQVVSRKSTGEVFHDQVGYWMWDADQRLVMQSIAIPRGVCVLAGGNAEIGPAGTQIRVAARVDDPDWGIVQSPFMRKKAKTIAFSHLIEVSGDQLKYRETTNLEIYGKRFEHTDTNELTRQA